MKSIIFVNLLIFLVKNQIALAYPGYKNEVPNGNRVPHPCDRSTTWNGVGHESHLGGGPRNLFGKDFANEGYMWTQALCEKDSDGDGKTNGEELGDPSCVWTKGGTPAVTDPAQLTHPGVCEPLTDPTCQLTNSFLEGTQCAALGLTTPDPSSWCPLAQEPDVQSIELTFNNVTLTDEETQYMCQEFFLPKDQDYQMIAWQPIIDNREILHHTIMYACDYIDDSEDLDLADARLCKMTPKCGTMVITWAYGIDGQCFTEQVGAPFGNSSYNRVILQHHYNNEARKPGYVDSSGVRIFYTNKLRPKSRGIIAFGDAYLIVPPKTPYVEASSELPPECTTLHLQPAGNFSLVSLLVHIHKQGSYGYLAIEKKDGRTIVIVDDPLEYDRPKTALYAPGEEILIEGGDRVIIKCGFSSMNKDDWTFFGSQTADEMCYFFMDIYPRPYDDNFLMPQNYGSMDNCDFRGYTSNEVTLNGCNWPAFWTKMELMNEFGRIDDPNDSEPTREMMENCVCLGPENYPAKSCSFKCYQTMVKYKLFDHPCITDDKIFQIGMRKFYDDSDHLHRAQSQMTFCETLVIPPNVGQTCEAPMMN